jgi:hypothetical protein
MEAVRSSEMLITFYETTLCDVPQGSNLFSRRSENFRHSDLHQKKIKGVYLHHVLVKATDAKQLSVEPHTTEITAQYVKRLHSIITTTGLLRLPVQHKVKS